MSKFGGRNMYTPQKVVSTRNKRQTFNPQTKIKDYRSYLHSLGKLKGMGHMRIEGSVKKTANGFEIGLSDIQQSNVSPPHFKGYLVSSTERDVRYRVKGWFNDRGILRMEVCSEYDIKEIEDIIEKK